MQENKSVKEMTDQELKALGFDIINQLNVYQSNLNVINNELISRKQPAVSEAQTVTAEPPTEEVSGEK